LSLFEPFNKSDLKLKNNQTTWKDAYTLEKDNIEKNQKNKLYKFNTTNKHKVNVMFYNQKLKNIEKCTKQINGKIFY
jgi:hypothetical protein